LLLLCERLTGELEDAQIAWLLPLVLKHSMVVAVAQASRSGRQG
jgi:hypothetical protein